MKLNSAVIVPTAPHFIVFDDRGRLEDIVNGSLLRIPAKAVPSL